MSSPDVFQAITALASMGAFGLLLRIESRLTRVETKLNIK